MATVHLIDMGFISGLSAVLIETPIKPLAQSTYFALSLKRLAWTSTLKKTS
jgi:hypothetical protein